MDSDLRRPAQRATPFGLGTILGGCLFLLAGVALAVYGVFAFLVGDGSQDQTNTWLGLFIAVGGGQLLGAHALMARGIPEFEFWQVRSVLPTAQPTDRCLIWLQVPFQAGALAGIALYVVLSPGGYVPIYLLALSAAVVIVCWNTYRTRAISGAHVTLYLLAAAVLLRFARIALG